MTKIDKFEDITAWQEAKELTNNIYTITKEHNFFNDFFLRNQIRSASVSIMANIAEGLAAEVIRNLSTF